MKGFSGFTNLYQLSKTLRFELRPVGKTKDFFEKIRQTDKQRDRYYQEIMKPILDKFHNRFIVESLQKVEFPKKLLKQVGVKINNLAKLSKNRKGNEAKIKSLKQEIFGIQEKLRTKVVLSFNTVAKKWREKYKRDFGIDLKYKKGKGYEILTGKEIFGSVKKKGLLEIIYKNDKEKLKAIKYFKGFSMYFCGFNQNRENYYKNDNKHTEIAYRIINENLPRFLKNKRFFTEISQNIGRLKKFSRTFSLENFQNLLIQEAIDNFNKNVIGEINYEVNQYNQKYKVKLPKLETLYKQIGSPKKDNFVFEIKKGQEWKELENLKNAQNKFITIEKGKMRLLPTLKKHYGEFFLKIDSVSLTDIYFNKQSINTISSYWFNSWRVLADLLKIKFDKKTGEQKIPAQVSLRMLKDALEPIMNVLEKDKNGETNSSLFAYFRRGRKNKYGDIVKKSANAWESFLAIWKKEIIDNFAKIQRLEKELEKKKTNLFTKKIDGSFVKNLCDAYLAIERMTKYHKVKDHILIDTNFYHVFDIYWQESELNRYYNAFRNYISRKPYSQNKIKLNFETPNLLGGWSDGQERNKAAVLLKEEERGKTKYYLGILKNRGLFRTDKENPIYVNKSSFSRLILRILKFQTLTGKGFVSRFGTKFSSLPKMEAVEKLQKLIQEKYLEDYPKLQKVVAKKYDTKRDFTKEVNEILNDSYYTRFMNIDKSRLMQAVKNGEIYLFQIYNKDFSEYKNERSRDNIHTKYWKSLFSEENFKNPLIALSANGEVFFRQASVKEYKNIITQNKKNITNYLNKKYGKTKYRFDRYIYYKKKNNKILKKSGKILFHIPIKINFKSPKNLKFNKKVNTEYLQENKTKIIGVDRGEKHLVYISVIDQKGDVIEQKTLNLIEVAGKRIDFHERLKNKARQMKEARKNWEEIGAIKNFKEGYLSYVVYEIYKLIEKYQAIVVLEDLNTKFKLKRTAKVEYSLYKKFELALAKKLNNLVFKDKKAGDVGGVLNALQLTPKIETGNVSIFEKSKQWGILYYVRPNYTSTTDPLTGWRKHKYISNGSNSKRIKEFFTKEDIKIDFDMKKNCFVFSYFHNNRKWHLYAFKGIERFHYFPQSKETSRIDLYKEFDKLLGEYKKSRDIFLALQKRDNFSWKTLVYLWNLLNQIRNTDRSKEGNDNDFLQSPVWSDEIQGFFDSRKAYKYKKILPENGDANGAYNTARKGLILLNRILKNPNKKVDLFISDKDWDEFATR